jgi:hypothetical protein
LDTTGTGCRREGLLDEVQAKVETKAYGTDKYSAGSVAEEIRPERLTRNTFADWRAVRRASTARARSVISSLLEGFLALVISRRQWGFALWLWGSLTPNFLPAMTESTVTPDRNNSDAGP